MLIATTRVSCMSIIYIQISGYHTSNTRSFGCWLFGDATADLAILSSFLLKTNVAESVVVVD